MMNPLPFRNFVHLSQQEAHDLMARVLSGDLNTEGIAEVLAFLRRDEQEQALVVANLSRFSQPVELDLSDYKGATPVEMFRVPLTMALMFGLVVLHRTLAEALLTVKVAPPLMTSWPFIETTAELSCSVPCSTVVMPG